MEKWEDIKGIGSLYNEIELVVGCEVVLFVCTDDVQSSRYLVMTYDSFEGEYVISKIKNKILLEMLNNKITMEQAFRASDLIYFTHIDSENGLASDCSFSKSFPEQKLPDVGAFYNIHSDYILNYINRLEQIINSEVKCTFCGVLQSGSRNDIAINSFDNYYYENNSNSLVSVGKYKLVTQIPEYVSFDNSIDMKYAS